MRPPPLALWQPRETPPIQMKKAPRRATSKKARQGREPCPEQDKKMKKAGRGSLLVSLMPALRLGVFQVWYRMRGNQEALVGGECGVEVRLAVRAGAVARSGADQQHCLLPCAMRLVSWVRIGSPKQLAGQPGPRHLPAGTGPKRRASALSVGARRRSSDAKRAKDSGLGDAGGPSLGGAETGWGTMREIRKLAARFKRGGDSSESESEASDLTHTPTDVSADPD